MRKAATKTVKKLTPAEQVNAITEISKADDALAKYGAGLSPARFKAVIKGIVK